MSGFVGTAWDSGRVEEDGWRIAIALVLLPRPWLRRAASEEMRALAGEPVSSVECRDWERGLAAEISTLEGYEMRQDQILHMNSPNNGVETRR
jgi:hypothetical protein